MAVVKNIAKTVTTTTVVTIGDETTTTVTTTVVSDATTPTGAGNHGIPTAEPRVHEPSEPEAEPVFYTNGSAKSKKGKFHIRRNCDGLKAIRTPLIMNNQGVAVSLKLEPCKLCVL